MRHLVTASAFLVFAGCATQPPPCQVVATQGSTPAYLARLTTRETSGTCTGVEPLAVMRLGVQAFSGLGDGGPSLGLRAQRFDDLAEGRVFTANTDARNDCQAALEGDPQPRCETCSADGGNACVPVADPVKRVDPGDPTGAHRTAVGPFAAEPTAGRCPATGSLVAEQSFRAESLRLVDGGSAVLPALDVRLSFSDVSVITTPDVPGSAFTATLTRVEGACTTVSDVVAFFPAVACARDTQCATAIDLDAGVSTVSGLNPAFKPVCDTTIGFCVPTVDVTKPGLPALP
ncbi:MAG: hypothetical protein SFW67_31055 [Myxococcaceae bacterium]|nr:hypothetical protein [Myxococcaceae bacterium]